MGAKLVEACAVKSTMREQTTEMERRIMALKTQLEETQLALENRTGKSSKTESEL